MTRKGGPATAGTVTAVASGGGPLRYTTIRCHIKIDKDENIFTEVVRGGQGVS